jgi:hypothetical protein
MVNVDKPRRLAMIWNNFFTAGGLGMYPISVDGFLLLASALLLALRPERRFVPLVVSLALLTLGAGVLGTLVGIVSTLHYVATTPTGQVQTLIMGAAEASHCLVLALLVIMAALALTAIAAWRASRTRTAG